MFKRHVLSRVQCKNTVLALICSACSMHAVAASSVAASNTDLQSSIQLDSVPSHVELMYQANPEGSTLLHFQPNTASVYSQRLVLSAEATLSHLQVYLDGPTGAKARVSIRSNGSGALVGEGPNSVLLVDTDIVKLHDGLEWVTLGLDTDLDVPAGQVFVSLEPLDAEVTWQMYSTERQPFCEAQYVPDGAVQSYSSQILIDDQPSETPISLQHFNRDFALKLFGAHSSEWSDGYNAAKITGNVSLGSSHGLENERGSDEIQDQYWTQIPEYVGVLDYNGDGTLDVLTSRKKFVSNNLDQGGASSWEVSPLFHAESSTTHQQCISTIPLMTNEETPRMQKGLLVYSESNSSIEVFEINESQLQFRTSLYTAVERPTHTYAILQDQSIVVVLQFSHQVVALEIDPSSLDVRNVRKLDQEFETLIPVTIESDVYLAGINATDQTMSIFECVSLYRISTTSLWDSRNGSKTTTTTTVRFVLTQLANGTIYAIESAAPSMSYSPTVYTFENLLDDQLSIAVHTGNDEFQNPLWLAESVQSQRLGISHSGSAEPEVVVNSSCSCISPRRAESPFSKGEVVSTLAQTNNTSRGEHKIFCYDLNADGYDDMLSFTNSGLTIFLADTKVGAATVSMTIVDESMEGLIEVLAYSADYEAVGILSSYTHPRYESPTSIAFGFKNFAGAAGSHIDSVRVVGSEFEQVFVGPYESGVYTYRAGALHRVDSTIEGDKNQPEVVVDVFPQPASAVVRFNINRSISEKANIEIFDVQGTTVFSQTFQLFEGSGEFVWNIPSTISNGTYAYTIQMGQESEPEAVSAVTGVLVVQK